MATHVALLRGINLGGKNKVAMADLRALVAELGHADVSTYIQSGNVLFTADLDADCALVARTMTDAIAVRLGVTAPVVVVTRDELGRIHAANPFPDETDPKRVHAVVLSAPPGPELTARLDAAAAAAAAKGAADAAIVVDRTLYLHTPAGYGTSDLSAAVLRIVSSPKAGVTGTARNWATMTKLLELCGSLPKRAQALLAVIQGISAVARADNRIVDRWEPQAPPNDPLSPPGRSGRDLPGRVAA